MDCPHCNHEIQPTEAPDGSMAFACGRCGWGQERDVGVAVSNEPEPINWLRFGMYWLGALVVLIGPYAAVRIGLPILLERDPELLDIVDLNHLFDLLNLNYWWIMLVYVGLAAIVTPKVDTDDLGWGGMFIDNPFSFTDDYNRFMLAINIVLMPGKIVYIAFRNTVLIGLHMVKR